MNAVHKLLIDAMREVVEPVGGTVGYKTGAKHSFAMLHLGNTSRKVAVSNGTKTVQHQLDWSRQAARRFVRDCAPEAQR